MLELNEKINKKRSPAKNKGIIEKEKK